jgi:hypothetical protein
MRSCLAEDSAMTGFYYFITSVIAGLISNAITIYFQKENKMDSSIVVLCIYFVLMVIIGIFAFNHYRKISSKIKDMDKMSILNKITNLHSVLYKYVSHPEQLKIITSGGKELIGGHAGNYDWKELTEWLCKNMGLKHLRYSNLGSAYHLVDIESGKEYKIPTDNMIEAKIETSGLRNGQILLTLQRYL